MKTDNIVIGTTGKCKGNIETHNANLGFFDGDLKASGTSFKKQVSQQEQLNIKKCK